MNTLITISLGLIGFAFVALFSKLDHIIARIRKIEARQAEDHALLIHVVRRINRGHKV